MARDRYDEAKRRRELRKRAIEFLGRFCGICGYDGLACPPAVDFHHPDAYEKDFSISAKMTSFRAIEAELKKCVLLCARCHREVHDGLHPGFLAHADAMRGQMDDDGGYDGEYDA